MIINEGASPALSLLQRPVLWGQIPRLAVPKRRPSLPSSPRRRGPAPAVAAAAPIIRGFSWVATGVPLVEHLSLLSLEQAVVRSAGLLAATALGLVLGRKILSIVECQITALVERKQQANSFVDLLTKTALTAAHHPAQVILGFYAVNFGLLVLSALTLVLVTKMDPMIHTTATIWGQFTVGCLRNLTQFLQDSTEILLITFAAWFLISWKNKVIDAMTSQLSEGLGEDGTDNAWARFIVPMGTLLTWAIVAAAFGAALVCCGIDVKPLLAVGSVGSIVVGISAQSTIANFLSAMSLYTSSPFIKGDRIQLKSLAGSVIVAGIVEFVRPLRTMIRTDDKIPVYINNKDVATLMIVNESQMRKGAVISNPLVDTSITVRYEDVDKVEAIEKDIEAFLGTLEEVEPGTGKCALREFTERGPVLRIKAALKMRAGAAGRSMYVRANMLRGAERIVKQHGAALFSVPERLYLENSPPS